MIAASVLATGSGAVAAPNENGVVEPTAGAEKIVFGNFEVSKTKGNLLEGVEEVSNAFTVFGT